MMRNASLSELKLLLDWAAAEGWNPGLDDAEAFLAADPEGVFVALREGRPVAGISVVNHGPGLAFLGLYLCHPDWRGQGIGYALWQHALAHAGTRCVGLDGVPAQEANYARSGFVKVGASQRFEGALRPAGDPEIRAVQAGDIPALVALDAAAGGVTRAGFLSGWIAGAPGRTSVMRRDGAGFATIRRCGLGAKIGPVVAPDAGAALALIRAALQALPAETPAQLRPAIVDVPSANGALRALLEAEGLQLTFETARMYRGTPPVTGPGLQAIATMELG